jgi:hypothetical protein
MIYLATSSSPAINQCIRDGVIGRLCTPRAGNSPTYGTWAADSGCFTRGDGFSLPDYFAWLKMMSRFADRCLFAPAPDVVADHWSTMERSLPVLPDIRAAGYRPAFIAQDGSTPPTIPWDMFDVVFIGGSTEWKLGDDAASIVREAKDRGKGTHMGRVNSRKRFLYAQSLGCDSADGTFISFAPTENLPRMLRWLER